MHLRNHELNLSAREKIGRHNQLPLIYQNGAGNGQLGQNLPPGAYQVSLEVFFYGPRRTQGGATPAPGANFKASVPIVIE